PLPISRDPSMKESEIDLTKTYDAIVVGSGAAGGMAAHVLTSHGMKVLLLEAGKKLDIEQELRSMEWPFDHPRRGGMPPGTRSLTLNEYTIRQPPYGPGFEKYKNLYSYVGDEGKDYVKNILVDERENPYSGTNYAWVRARCLGGKTNIWGRLALRLSDYDFKAKTRDGYGEDWPISYGEIAPYYDKVDIYLGITGVKENLPYLRDSIFQCPTKLTCAEVTHKQGIQQMKQDDNEADRLLFVAAPTNDSALTLLISKSRLEPHVLEKLDEQEGDPFCQHVRGPGVAGRETDLVGNSPALDHGRSGGSSPP